MGFFKALAGALAEAPGIGKHKTVIGSAGLVASAALNIAGEAHLAATVGEFASIFLGVGLLDKARKNRAEIRVNGRF